MGQSWDHFCHLDEDEYASQISQLDEDDLRKEHAIMSRKLLGAGASTGASVGGAFFTGGFTLITAAVSARRINVNARRKEIIERRLAEKGWSEYKLRKRDFAIPIVAAGLGGLVAPGADAVVGHLAGHAVGTAAAHHGAQTLGAAVRHPGLFTHAAEKGIEAQVAEVTHHAVNGIGAGSVGNATTVLGASAGHALAATAEAKGLGQATKWVLKKGLEKGYTEDYARESKEDTSDVDLVEVSDDDEDTSESSSSGGDSEDEDDDDDSETTPSPTTDADDSELLKPLMEAVINNDIFSVESLANSGTDLDATDSDGWTALFYAIAISNAPIVQALLYLGADPNSSCSSQTALMHAIGFEESIIVESLLNSGADIDTQDGDGWTALMFAVSSRRDATMRLLFQRGASTQVLNNRGETVFDIAVEKGLDLGPMIFD